MPRVPILAVANGVARGGSALLRSRLAPRSLQPGETAELVDHLDELRKRLFVCVGTLVVAFIAAYVVHEHMIELLNRSLPSDVPRPITFGIAEPFITSLKVSMWAAFGVATPVLLWQFWGFARPAFKSESRRAVTVFVLAGTMLFTAGVLFAYFVALPSSVRFLLGYDSHLYDVQIRAKDFYTFSAAVLVSIGAVFELPLVMLALVKFRILTYDRMRKNRRIAYVALTALAVILPGVDPVLTLLEIVPLAILFEATVLIAGRMEKRWAADAIRREHAAELRDAELMTRQAEPED